MYKYALFDMDGTVLDTLQDLTDAVNHTLSEYGYPLISTDTCAKNLGNGARQLLTLSAPDGADIDLMLQNYLPYYNSHCLIKTGPYAGIPELMKELGETGVRCAIISNKPDAATAELGERFFKGLVDYCVGEKPGINRKPAPDTVISAMDYFGASREDCVYIGDTEVDIITAKNSGIDCIAVSWGFRSEDELKESGAECVVHSVSELRDKIVNG